MSPRDWTAAQQSAIEKVSKNVDRLTRVYNDAQATLQKRERALADAQLKLLAMKRETEAQRDRQRAKVTQAENSVKLHTQAVLAAKRALDDETGHLKALRASKW